MRTQLTYKIAMAAGQDAANRRRKAGRVAWSEDDYNLATSTVEQLWHCGHGMLPGEQCSICEVSK